MLAGLPLIAAKENSVFRRYLNTQLGQHIHVVATEIPIWVEKESEESLKTALAAKIVLMDENEVNLGLYLLVIRRDLEATIMSLTGECCYHVGSVECDSAEGCIFLVHFSRKSSDLFMGGTLCIIDVFSFDGVNYADKPYSERVPICRFLHKTIILPSRFQVISSFSKKVTKPFQVTYILLK
jgi:hypothetical protein